MNKFDKEFHYLIIAWFAILGLTILVVGFAKAIKVGKVPTSASASLNEPVGKLPRVVNNADEKGCEK